MSVSATNKNKMKTLHGLKDSSWQLLSIYKKKLELEMDLSKLFCCVWCLSSNKKCLKPEQGKLML